MATFIATDIVAPTLSGLTADGNQRNPGILLNWTVPKSTIMFATEIWASHTNNRALATLIDTVVGTNHYTHFPPTNSNYYYWIRAVTIFGKASGAWYPTSSTGGVLGNDARPFVTHDLTDPNPALINANGAWQDVLTLYAYNPGTDTSLAMEGTIVVGLDLSYAGAVTVDFRWNCDSPTNVIYDYSTITSSSGSVIDHPCFTLPIYVPANTALISPHSYKLQFRATSGLASISRQGASFSWDYPFFWPA